MLPYGKGDGLVREAGRVMCEKSGPEGRRKEGEGWGKSSP